MYDSVLYRAVAGDINKVDEIKIVRKLNTP